ncbi:hypothetical protein LTR27_000241 [Elasticomyces elasticus]|nr:hypothetical protein LTR27_000241 [Elasticomyces elasticus]
MPSTRKMEISTKLSEEKSTTLTMLMYAGDLYTAADLKHKGSILVGFAMGYFGYEAWKAHREKCDGDVWIEGDFGKVRDAARLENLADANLWSAVEKCGEHDMELGTALSELAALEILPSHGPDD